MAMYALELICLGVGIVSSSLSTGILRTEVTVPVSSSFQAPTLANKTTEEKAIVEYIKKDQLSETSVNETDRLKLSSHVDSRAANLRLTLPNHVGSRAANLRLTLPNHLGSRAANLRLTLPDHVDTRAANLRLTQPDHVDSSPANLQDTLNNASLLLHLNSKGLDQLTASWTIDVNTTEITNFVVTYRTGKGEHYDSNPLDKLVREYTFGSMDKDEEYTVCVHAMINSTSVLEVCSVWSESSMKVIVGVLAGVIGLIPCFVALIWVMRLDKKMVAYDILDSTKNELGEKEDQMPVKDDSDGGMTCIQLKDTQKDFKVNPSQGNNHLHEGCDNYCFSPDHAGEYQSGIKTRHHSTGDNSELRTSKRQDLSSIHYKDNQFQQASIGHSGVTLNVADLTKNSETNCNHSIISENTIHITAECSLNVGNVDISSTKETGQYHGQVKDSSILETDTQRNVGQYDVSFDSNIPAFTITHF